MKLQAFFVDAMGKTHASLIPSLKAALLGTPAPEGDDEVAVVYVQQREVRQAKEKARAEAEAAGMDGRDFL